MVLGVVFYLSNGNPNRDKSMPQTQTKNARKEQRACVFDGGQIKQHNQGQSEMEASEVDLRVRDEDQDFP